MMQGYTAEVPAREQFIDLNGCRHRVLRWGPEDAAPIVLLHGFQDCADTFQFLVDALPRDWNFLGLDWRGFGGSAWQQRSYWFPDYLADLDALLEQVSPHHPARLIGHSMGGNVANLYAGVRPERVSHLVSLEGFGLPRTPAEQAPLRYAKWLEQLRAGPQDSRYQTVEQLAAHLQKRNARLPAPHAIFIADAWMRLTEDGSRKLHFDPYHRFVNPVLHRRDESEACWHRVDAETLLVLASESEYRQRLDHEGDVERMNKCFRKLVVEDLAGLGHMLHHEEPQRVAQVIERWFLSKGGVT